MSSAKKLWDFCDNNRAVSQERASVYLLTAIVLGILVLTSTIGRAQNLLMNGSLTSTTPTNSVMPINTASTAGTNTTAIPNWAVTNAGASGANNYSINGNQTTDGWIPDPPASILPVTYSVDLDSSSAGPNNGLNNTISYNNTVQLLANARYDLSFYLNSETAMPGAAGTSAASTLKITGTGIAIASVSMVNAGSASGTHVATGFSNTVSGTTVSLTAPVTATGSTNTTQPWVKVDIIFTTTGAVLLPANSILFTDLGNPVAESNNSSVADFSLTQVVPEFCDWRLTAGFCTFCVAFPLLAKRKGTNRRLILKSGGRSELRIDAGLNAHKTA